MASTVILITGANSGIGLEAVKALMRSQHAYTIVISTRSPSQSEETVTSLKEEIPDSKSLLETLQIDLTSDESIAKAFEEFKRRHDKLDVLVNNGGANFDGMYPGQMSLRETFIKAYDVNVAGTQVLTHTFVPLLIRAPNPRLLFLTSGTSTLAGGSKAITRFGKPGGNPFPAGWPKPPMPPLLTAYRSSKTALNMVALTWHWLLLEDGVKVHTLSPGFLATKLGGNQELLKKLGAGPPSQGGELVRSVVEGERDDEAGLIVNKDGVQAW